MKYLIYTRKSSESEERQVLSIPAQLHALDVIAEREGYKIHERYEESMSAKASGRPIFNRMLSFIQKSKEPCMLVVWNIDRLARNMVDGGMLLELMDQGRILEIQTFDKTYRNTPDDKFMMSLSFGIAKKYVDDLSVNVKRGLDEKMKRGEWPNRAPFGYLNDKATKGIVLDPVRSPYVRRAYELYLTGSHGFISIANILYEEGLRTASGKKVLKSHIQRILSTRFYTGVMERDGKLYEGKHEALITKQEFDDAHAIMTGVSRARPKSATHFFPLRGFMTCESCGCMMTASLKKGHQYYYCTNGRGNCDAHKRYLREEVLNKQVGTLLFSLRFSERKIAQMYAAAQIQINREGGTAQRIVQTLEQQLDALPRRESRLLDAFLAEQISQELYDEKVLALKHEGIELRKQLENARASEPVFTLEPTKEKFLRGSRATSEFLDGDDPKKRSILEELLGNLSIKNGKIEQTQFKSPYHILANAPKTGSISTLLGD